MHEATAPQSWQTSAPTLDMLRQISSHRVPEDFVATPDQMLTFAAADFFSDALATFLADACDVMVGDRVISMCTNGPEFAIAMIATNRLGAIFVPISPSMQQAPRAAIYADCDPKAVITNVSGASDTTNLLIRFEGDSVASSIRLRRFDTSTTIRFAEGAKNFKSPLQSEITPAMILYSSGSTGQPKGIVISHGNLRSALDSITEYLEIPWGSRIFSGLSPAFDYGLYQYLIAIRTASAVIVDQNPVLIDQTLVRLASEAVDVLPLVPTTIRRMRSIWENDKRHFPKYPGVSIVTSTGSALDAASIDFLRESFPNARIFSMYGLTECKRATYLQPSKVLQKPESVGQAIPNCETLVLRKDGTSCKVGEIGELHVRGPNVALGYWNDESLTRRKFQRDPEDGTTILATGDLFWLDSEGDLYFVGRNDDIVKVNDHRVSLAEVEKALRAVPGIIDAVATLAEVDGLPKLAAHVQCAGGIEVGDIRKELRRLDQPSQLIPSIITLVSEIHVNQNGKPSRN